MHVGRSTGLAIAGLVAAGAIGAVAFARSRDEGSMQGDAPIVTEPPVSDPPVDGPTPQPPVVAAPPVLVTPPPIVAAPPISRPGPNTPQPVVPPQSTVDVQPAATTTFEYAVKSGDTLSRIARRCDTTVARLVELNQIADPNLIRVGQKLRIPGRAPAAPAPAAPAPAPAPRPPKPAGGGGQPAVPAGAAISRVAGASGKVALTFDDGPSGAYTDAILATLDRRGVDATFFVVGTLAARDGARLVRMRDAGHAIGNHSWDHPQLTSLTDAQVRRQLDDTSAAIKRATGTRPDTFRPPYGARSDRVDRIARDLGMRDVIWDVDTVDWSRPGTTAIANTAIRNARDGSIVLMHDGGGNRQQTVDALDRIITGLEDRGFELVTVPQLVAAG